MVRNEIVPETHRRGNEEPAAGGPMIGLVPMVFLDVTPAQTRRRAPTAYLSVMP